MLPTLVPFLNSFLTKGPIELVVPAGPEMVNSICIIRILYLKINATKNLKNYSLHLSRLITNYELYYKLPLGNGMNSLDYLFSRKTGNGKMPKKVCLSNCKIEKIKIFYKTR